MQLSPTRWDGAFNRLRGLSCPLFCLSKVQRTAVKRIVKCFGEATASKEEKLSASTNYCSWQGKRQLLTSAEEFFDAPLTIPRIKEEFLLPHNLLLWCIIRVTKFNCDRKQVTEVYTILYWCNTEPWATVQELCKGKKWFCLWPCSFWSYFRKGYTWLAAHTL